MEEFQTRWQSNIGIPPIAELFKEKFKNNWVRIYGLQNGKRLPRSDKEKKEVLNRANKIISSLGAKNIFVITTDLGKEMPNRTYWRAIAEKEANGYPARNVYINTVEWNDGCLDDLLLGIANDEYGGVILVSPDFQWLLHPYDGGFDVIVFNDEKRLSVCQWLEAFEPMQRL